MRSTSGALLLLFLALLPVRHAIAEMRIALVVGVSAYDSPDIQGLPNAINDARAIDAKLRTLGFDSTLLKNPTRDALRGALSSLFDRRRAQGAETVLIFFAGHGVQFGSAGYLLSRDSKLASSDEMELQQEVPVADLLDAVGEAKLAILLLDACRNTPAFTARVTRRSDNSVTAGLPLANNIRTDAVVSYSAEPGAQALDGVDARLNSPYAEALLDYMGRTGVELGPLLQGVRRYVRGATKEEQSPVYEDRRRPEISFYFRQAGLLIVPPSFESQPVPAQPGRVSARETLALLASRSGAARGQALGELIARPGLLTPISVEEALALLGDIPIEAGHRRRALTMLLPLLTHPIGPGPARSLLSGLDENGRLAALSAMFGCLARPVPELQARELVEGIPRRDIPWVYRELTSLSNATARCGEPP